MAKFMFWKSERYATVICSFFVSRVLYMSIGFSWKLLFSDETYNIQYTSDDPSTREQILYKIPFYHACDFAISNKIHLFIKRVSYVKRHNT